VLGWFFLWRENAYALNGNKQSDTKIICEELLLQKKNREHCCRWKITVEKKIKKITLL